MQLINMVSVEYSKVLPDGTTTVLQEQSNITKTTLIPRKQHKTKVINTYNFPPAPAPNTNTFSIWGILLILLIIRIYTE